MLCTGTVHNGSPDPSTAAAPGFEQVTAQACYEIQISGNTLRGTYYIDGKAVFPMMVQVPDVAQCPGCRRPGKLQILASQKLSAKYLGPFVCESETVHEQYTLRFARSIRIISVCTDVRHVEANLTYRASYRRTGPCIESAFEGKPWHDLIQRQQLPFHWPVQANALEDG